jgi:uncharacterized membrane protein YdjX (TVP38/TMEM64 family)
MHDLPDLSEERDDWIERIARPLRRPEALDPTFEARLMTAVRAASARRAALRARAGGLVHKLEAGFRENALSYLLVLRLVPLFPFWLVNLAAAVLGVPPATYVLGTFVGIIPGSYVYASIGAGLGSVFDQGGEPSLKGALTPQVLVALAGLAALSLVPVAYKRLKARRSGTPL